MPSAMGSRIRTRRRRDPESMDESSVKIGSGGRARSIQVIATKSRSICHAARRKYVTGFETSNSPLTEIADAKHVALRKLELTARNRGPIIGHHATLFICDRMSACVADGSLSGGEEGVAGANDQAVSKPGSCDFQAARCLLNIGTRARTSDYRSWTTGQVTAVTVRRDCERDLP